MEQFNHVFEYVPRHCIAVCKQHRQGILQGQLHTHLRSHHPEVPAKTRQEICLAAATACHQWASTKDAIRFPPGLKQPIPHLEVYKNGLGCTACTYINRSIERMQEHCRKEHGWANSKKRGRPYKGQLAETERMWREGVWC